MSKKLINLTGISKSYGDHVVLDDLNLYIRENEFITLLGPSGCGKTTTLRIIGGFETPDAGSVIFDGKDITSLPPNERNLNTVFQKYALFPHMSIAENIAFGLRIKKKSKEYINDKIAEAGLAENKIELGDDEYFVIGDNCNNSEDSRSANIGNIKKEHIIGKAWFKMAAQSSSMGFVN